MKINATFTNVNTGQVLKVDSLLWTQLEGIAKGVWSQFYPDKKFPYDDEDFNDELHFGDDFLVTEFPSLRFSKQLESEILKGAKIVHCWKGDHNAVILVRYPKGKFIKPYTDDDREFEFVQYNQDYHESMNRMYLAGYRNGTLSDVKRRCSDDYYEIRLHRIKMIERQKKNSDAV